MKIDVKYIFAIIGIISVIGIAIADQAVIRDNSASSFPNGITNVPKFKLINTTHDISVTGTQSIVGVGFTPKSVSVYATKSEGNSTSFGMTDGNAYSAVVNGKDNVAGLSIYSNQFIQVYTGTNIFAYAALTSIDSDGMTITWGKIGAPTGTVNMVMLFEG